MSTLYEDITPEEESQLPLPSEWMRTIQIRGSDGVQMRIYRNIRTGLEIDEHPIIAKAMNIVRKLPLPAGWCLVSTSSPNGHFYYNADLKLSLWDPPLLRQCLADYLTTLGIDPLDIGFRVGNTDGSTNNHAATSINESELSSNAKLSVKDLGQNDLEQGTAPVSPMDIDTLRESTRGSDSANGSNSLAVTVSDGAQIIDSSGPPAHSSTRATRDWEGLLNLYREPIQLFAEKVSHRVGNDTQPPLSWLGVHMLRQDVNDANERVHHLLLKIRSALAAENGLECSFLYHDSTTNVLRATRQIKKPPRVLEIENADDDSSSSQAQSEEKDVEDEQYAVSSSTVTLASDIVTTLRQQPDFVIMALASKHLYPDVNGGRAMFQTAFVAMQRLLHPFSTDSSMTTALLLQAINYQLDELSAVEAIFCHVDSRKIIPRALCIHDPVAAVQWDPVVSPMPLMPLSEYETVFACLMRTYGIRRDTTAYFRAIWKPALQSGVALLDTSESLSNSVVVENLFSLGYRLLENAFHEKAITVFPIPATSVCRAVYDIGGQEAMLSVMFNFLLLPNLIKIFGGDHDSLENEDILSEATAQTVNRYFDWSWWINNETNPKNKDEKPLILLRSLLWITWRMFSCAAYLEESAVAALTVNEFMSNRLSFLNSSAFADHRLRVLISRTQRKIIHGTKWLLQLPLDSFGNRFLGLSNNETDLQLDGSLQLHQETHELLDRRMLSLSFKPAELLNLTVISRSELTALLADVGMAMDEREVSEELPLYRAIADWLTAGHEEPENDNSEQFLTLTFLYNKNTESEDNADAMEQEYHQLLRALRLANRYEDTLVHLVHKQEHGVVSNIHELFADAQWYLEPEFDLEFHAHHVRLAEKHTIGSKGKHCPAKNGIKQSQPTRVFPLLSQHNETDHHPNHRTLTQLQSDFVASLRFGSSQTDVAVGTSMAREKVLPAKVEAGRIKVTTQQTKSDSSAASMGGDSQSQSRRRSQFTEPSISKHSSLLVPTQSVRNYKNTLAETPKELDESFMKSMRSHEVIDTDEFQTRYFRRRQNASMANKPSTDQSMRRLDRSREQEIAANRPAPAPKPFPAHLRHLIRNNDGHAEEGAPVTSHDSQHGAESPEGLAYVHSLLRDYRDTIRQSQRRLPSSTATLSRLQSLSDRLALASPVQADTDWRGNNGSDAVEETSLQSRERSRSPTMPRALSGSKLWSPTKSHSQKLAQSVYNTDTNNNQNRRSGGHGGASNEFLRDLHAGRPPELRKYERDERTSAHHDRDFSPTKTRVHHSTGPRAPRVPAFLDPESAQRSRPRSRSSSPGSSRYLNPTLSTMQHAKSKELDQELARSRQLTESGRYYSDSRSSSPASTRRSKNSSPHSSQKRPPQLDVDEYDSATSSLSATPRRDHWFAEREEVQSLYSIPAALTPNIGSETPMPQSMVEEDRKPLTEQQHTAIAEGDADARLPKPNTEFSTVKVVRRKPSALKMTGSPLPTPADSDTVSMSRSDSDSLAAGQSTPPPKQARRDSALSSAVPSSHKQSFAEAIATVLNQAAAEADAVAPAPTHANTVTESNSTAKSEYFCKFSTEADGERVRTDLSKDRSQLLQKRKELLQRQVAEDDFSDEELKYIECDASHSGESSRRAHSRKSKREIPTPEHSPKVPLIKRQSLIKPASANKDILLNGFAAIKHGRLGQPKQKRVFYNETNDAIQWSDLRRSSVSSFFGTAPKEPSLLPLREVTRVCKGTQTDVFQKSSSSLDPNCCLSLISPHRTLDLVLDSPDSRDSIYKGLQAIAQSKGLTVDFS